MCIFLISVLLIALEGFIDRAEGLVELPQVEDNEILNTENLIRSSTNDLFSSLNLKGVKEKPRLKQYALIHNFFISLTLRDHNTLKEVARLTRIDKTIDNKTGNFITLLNEILNGDHSSEVQERNTTITEDVDEDFINYLDSQLKGLGYLKLDYVNNNPPADINKGIIDILSRNDELRTFNETVNKEESFDDNMLIHKVPGEQSGRRIFKGHRSKIKHYPFVAVVQMFGRFQCGGAIISTDMVITAASCVQLAFNNRFYRENPSFLSVRVGSNYYNGGGDVIPVMEIYFHPQYEPKTLQNNLAGLRMRLHLFFYKKAKKIEIDRISKPLPSNTPGIMIVGWGAKSRSNIVKSPWENKLSVDELPFYPLRICQEIYSKEYVTEKNFCAGYNVKGSGACNSDAGNPGVASGKLVGIVSFGSPVCGEPDYPTVFVKLGYYVDWIDAVLLEQTPRKSIIKKQPKTTYNAFNAWTTPATPRKPMTKAISNKTEENIQLLRFDFLPRVKKADSDNIEDLDLDKEMFRDFLSTMFNSSKEVQDYMDLVEETGNIQKICKTCKAGENLKPEKILESIGERFQNDSLISASINSLKSRMEYSANKSFSGNVTQINRYFDLLDIDDLSKNKSEDLNESEKKETKTTANTSKQDTFVDNSLLHILVDSAKKNPLVTNLPELPYTKMDDEILDDPEFRANLKNNDYGDAEDDGEEKNLNIELKKDRDLFFSSEKNGDLSEPIKLNEDFLKTPQDNEETMFRSLDDSGDEDSSKHSSYEETVMVGLHRNNLNLKSNYDIESLNDHNETDTDDISKTMTLKFNLDNLVDKVQNELLVAPNPE